MCENGDLFAERLARVETDISWIKKKLDNIDKRTWEILAVIIINWIVTIAVTLLMR